MKRTLIVALLVLVCGGALLFAQGQADGASTKLWPRTQPVVTVGFGAGGGTDTAVRPVIAKMEEYLGETINVVNMEGASSAVAAQHVLNRPADGYSMFATGSAPISGFRVMGTANSSWTDWVSWHPFVGPAALIVRADSPMKTFDDVVAYLRSKKVNFGISGFGVGPHVLVEAILGIAGVSSPNYVTGGSCRNAAVALIAGDVDVAMSTFSSVVDFVKAGQLRAIAVTTPSTYQVDETLKIDSITAVLPGSENIPQLSETWPIFMRRDVPQKYIDKLTEAFLWAIEQPEIVNYAKKQALDIAGYYGESADRFLSFSEAGYAWTLYDAGLASKSPAEFNIPKLSNWNWDVEKAKISK
ncbi:MAG: tripartite tricarboxylate transporter substrate-binding protein [Sphaerochaeta sp.]|jgi:tripartite-type tricarboxylate transporter receptor subunit TctC|nr:tripartite tricarboxylate transporter substrate-binding protein [Sphaerochaeta sp.]PKL27273.1 MAG: hypothetical protein CVV46_12490 [Spirochaetae bacterium HGW-Spirochaetae-2]